MYGLTMDRFSKQQITTALVVLIAAILAVLYYFDYIKLPAVVQPPKEKTQEELLNDFKADLMTGKLNNVSGVISKINGKIITIAISVNGDQKEQNIVITDNTLIRRLTMPELKPGDGLTPMVETFIVPADLRVGNNIFVNLNKDGMLVMVDVMPSPTNVAIAVGSQLAGTTTEQLPLKQLLSLKQRAFALMTAGKTIQIFGTITSMEKDVLTVQASTTIYSLKVKTDTVISDLREDPTTKKITENFISLADLHVGDLAIFSTDNDAKTASLIMRQKAI